MSGSDRRMQVPSTILRCLAGQPVVGTYDQTYPLLTTDPAGYPHVCLLSRAELDADEQEIRAVVASAGTIANLSETGRATLIAVVDDVAHYCKLRADRCWGSKQKLACSFSVMGHKMDSAGVPLTGMMFHVAEVLPVEETWKENDRLINLLRSRQV